MKYCGKCGYKLKGKEGLCPNCDKKKFIGHYKNIRFITIIIIPVAILLICAVIVSCLSIFGVIKFPFNMENENIRRISDDMYISTPNPENMQLDERSGVVYIDNEVLITFQKSTERKTVDSVVESVNGKIIGIISPTDTYQIQIESQSSFNKLEEVIDGIEEHDSVNFAGPNIIIVNETAAYYPKSDTEWTDEWPKKGDIEIPSGHNWGVEAIKAPYAWDYVDEMQDVNVGVYDNMFLEHEDLKYEDIAFNSTNHDSDGYEHGTHVSGTIAAGFDNDKGITGIVPKAKLFAWSFKRANELLGERYLTIRNVEQNREDHYTSEYPDVNDLAGLKLAITYFIAEKKCKVINFSVATEAETCYAASVGNQKAINYMNYCSKELEEYLLILLHNGYDFTLVVAAGNGNDEFFDVTEESARYPFGYKKVKESSELSGVTMSKYSYYLNNIENEEIKDRIIVVGAVKNISSQTEEKYQMCAFSNIDNRVDIVAPGADIQSTVDNNGYSYKWQGTSMAAPHVTGVAAILYSLKTNLPGDQVKSIIRDSATIKVNGVGLVDAQAAVKKLTEGSISGRVVSSTDNSPLESVEITVYQKKDSTQEEVLKSYTNEIGNFNISLPAGEYELYSSKDSFYSNITGVTIEGNVMTIIKDDIALKPIQNETVEIPKQKEQQFEKQIEQSEDLVIEKPEVIETEPDLREYTAVELASYSYNGIIELMGDVYQYDRVKLSSAFSAGAIPYIYNYQVLPGFAFATMNGDYYGISIMDGAKLNDYISSDMSYNQIADIIGNMDGYYAGQESSIIYCRSKIDGYNIDFCFVENNYIRENKNGGQLSSNILREGNPALQSIGLRKR